MFKGFQWLKYQKPRQIIKILDFINNRTKIYRWNLLKIGCTHDSIICYLFGDGLLNLNHPSISKTSHFGIPINFNNTAII